MWRPSSLGRRWGPFGKTPFFQMSASSVQVLGGIPVPEAEILGEVSALVTWSRVPSRKDGGRCYV